MPGRTIVSRHRWITVIGEVDGKKTNLNLILYADHEEVPKVGEYIYASNTEQHMHMEGYVRSVKHGYGDDNHSVTIELDQEKCQGTLVF
jgi:hypothetical protein